MKRSAMLLLREPKARFIGRSPASFFMRVSALHFQNKEHFLRSALCFGGATRIRTGDEGFADPCLTTWLWRHIRFSRKRQKSDLIFVVFKWSGLRGSNPPPRPWQGRALPNELNPHMVPPIGIEPTTRGFSVPCSTN